MFGSHSLSLSEQEFEKVRSSAIILESLKDIEAAYNILSESFIEFEISLLSLAAKHKYKSSEFDLVDKFFSRSFTALNLKLISCLTASRIYEEQVSRRYARISELSDFSGGASAIFSQVFDGSLEYRVMHALRNYALHHDLPLGYLTLNSSNFWEAGGPADGGPSRLRFTINPQIITSKLLRSDKIRAATRREIEGLCAEKLDLKYFLRGFISSISIVHENLRTETQDLVETSLQVLQRTRNEMVALKGEDTKLLVIQIFDADGNPQQNVDYTNFIDLVDKRKLWSGLKHIQRSYISSEIHQDAKSYPNSDPDLWIPK